MEWKRDGERERDRERGHPPSLNMYEVKFPFIYLQKMDFRLFYYLSKFRFYTYFFSLLNFIIEITIVLQVGVLSWRL